jgi:hypothetical protein
VAHDLLTGGEPNPIVRADVLERGVEAGDPVRNASVV